MKIQPTKRWLRENPHSKRCFFEPSKGYKVTPPKCDDCESEIKNCRIAINHRDKHNCGWCIGINLDKNNLDKIRLCQVAPMGKEDWSGEIQLMPIDITVDEALDLALGLGIAVLEYIKLDPEYRKEKGDMLRIKAKAIRRKNGNK